MKPDVSFIVLNWHNEPETAECIESIKSLTGKFKKQIIIVDNESNEKSYRNLKRIPDIDIVRNKQNLGFAGGVNSGLVKAKGSYAALINNDMVMDPQWLSEGIRILKDHTNACAVGGKEFSWDTQNPAYNDKNDFVAAPIVDPKWGFPQSTSRNLPEARVSCLMGGNVLVKTKRIKEVTGFDEDFFAYCEETDLCIRFLAMSWDIYYSPHMKVWHKRNLSSNRVPFLKIYLSQRNKLIFIAKHFEDHRWRHLTNIAIADGFLTSLTGKVGGIKNALNIHRPLISFQERKAYFLAASWGLTHRRYLKIKRSKNIRDGQHVADLSELLKKLQTIK